MKRTLLILVCILSLISCRIEPHRVSSFQLLSKLEIARIPSFGRCQVFYFQYDNLNRLISHLNYDFDSTGTTLDSVLKEKVIYQYTGSNVQPYYVEKRTFYQAGPAINYSYKTYNNNQLIKDSSFFTYLGPPFYPGSDVKDYSYGTNQIFTHVFQDSWIQVVYKDTSNLLNGNLTSKFSHLYDTIFGIPQTILYYDSVTYDNKINPLQIPFSALSRFESNHVNANNILTHRRKDGDSVFTNSQFTYDANNYPVLENMSIYVASQMGYMFYVVRYRY